MASVSDTLCCAARKVARDLRALTWEAPVTHVYHPLDYAWKPHRAYLRRFGNSRKRVLFVGMNPGPFGMAQTGVPFGEIDAVREWMKIDEPVNRPEDEHPKRPVEGFACRRSEVSGRRLWGFFAQRYPRSEDFFAKHFVHNYCPLLFLEETGRNRTPDKLPRAGAEALDAICLAHFRSVVRALRPAWLVGVGRYAEDRARAVRDTLPESMRPEVGRILHPSPASPAANRDWAGQAGCELKALGIWRA